MRSAGVRTQPTGPIPTDRDSLISVAAGLGSIALAVIIGIMLSGIIPEAPLVVADTPTPEASVQPEPSTSFLPSALPSAGTPTPAPTPALLGTVTFGLGLNQSTREVIDVTDTFGPGTRFCHSIGISEPFGVAQIQEEVLRVAGDGSLTVVQERQGSNLTVNPNGQVAGFCANANGLITGWGPGSYVLRDYRNADTPQLIAEGRFTLTN
jgi:hypothetical protein